MYTKSNRSSIKSQGIWLHCLCLPSSLIPLQFAMRKYNLHFSQAYCISNHSHIHAWVYVKENSNNGLKCHLIIYSNVCFYNEQNLYCITMRSPSYWKLIQILSLLIFLFLSFTTYPKSQLLCDTNVCIKYHHTQQFQICL